VNRKDLYQSMNQIDDDILERSEGRKKKKSSVWMKWGAVAACLCLVAIIGMKLGGDDNFVTLNINTITEAVYSAPKITSTIESVQVTEDKVNAWLGFELRDNLPKEIKNFTMKYYLVQDSEMDETLGIEVWGEVEDAEIPRPQFHITITEGKVLEELLFDYDVTTDIDGVTVIAGVMPGETRTNRDGEERYWPARYFSSLDVGVYHCTVETEGQVSEDTFSELNNILIDCLLENEGTKENTMSDNFSIASSALCAGEHVSSEETYMIESGKDVLMYSMNWDPTGQSVHIGFMNKEDNTLYLNDDVEGGSASGTINTVDIPDGEYYVIVFAASDNTEPFSINATCEWEEY